MYIPTYVISIHYVFIYYVILIYCIVSTFVGKRIFLFAIVTSRAFNSNVIHSVIIFSFCQLTNLFFISFLLRNVNTHVGKVDCLL